MIPLQSVNRLFQEYFGSSRLDLANPPSRAVLVLEEMEERIEPASWLPRQLPEGAAVELVLPPENQGLSSVFGQPGQASAQVAEVVFVDPAVQDYRTLVAGLARPALVVVLGPGQDGIRGMADFLAGQQGVRAVHILAHGLPGAVQLGSATLDQAGLEAHKDDLAVIRQALAPGADLLVYGCDVAAGAKGQAFVGELGARTGADVAASTGPTGAAAKGGDWVFEQLTGRVESAGLIGPAAEAAYQGLLAAPTQIVTLTSITDDVGNIKGVVGNGGRTDDTAPVLSGALSAPLADGQVVAIYRGGSRIGEASVSGTSWTFPDSGLAAGTTYAYAARVEQGAEQGPVSITYTITVDTTAPTVTSWGYSGNGPYPAGSNIYFYAYFDDSLTVTGSPRLQVEVAGVARQATFYYASGTTLAFYYTVQPNEVDNDGISVASPILLNGGTIRDTAGNDAVLTFTPPNLSGIRIDGTLPTVASVAPPANGSYRAGDVLDFTIYFDEAVTVTDMYGYYPPPRIAVDMGGVTRYAEWVSGAGTGTDLVFRYTVGPNDSDADGIRLVSPIVLGSYWYIRDAAGNNAVLTFAPPDTTGVTVYAVAPAQTAAITAAIDDVGAVQGLVANGSYTDDTAPELRGTLSAALGTGEKVVVYRNGSRLGEAAVSGTTWTYGDSGLADNSYTYTACVENADGYQGAMSAGYVVRVDTAAPMVTSWYRASNGTYPAGSNIYFYAYFNENVSVTGSPSLQLDIGGVARQAIYGGSGGNYLYFYYYPQSGEEDLDGISIASPILLNGGTIRDGAGHDAVLDFAPPDVSGIRIDATQPTVASVAVPTDGAYRAGDLLDFTVTFNEAVTVTNQYSYPTPPRIAVDVGGVTRYAELASGTGTYTNLVFRYAVGPNDSDADGIRLVSPILLDYYWYIRDAVGNNAVLTFAPPDTSGITVYAVAPAQRAAITAAIDDVGTIQGVVAKGGYTDDTAPVLSGTLSAALGTGEKVVVYRNGSRLGEATVSGTAWTYADSGLAPGGYTYTALVENDAYQGIPSAGYSIRVDTEAPVLGGVSFGSSAGIYKAGAVLEFYAYFNNDNPVVTGSPRLRLDIGGAVGYAEFQSVNGNAIIFRYTVAPGDNAPAGLRIASPIDLNGGSIRDAVGNAAMLTFAPPDASGFIIDTAGPTVASVAVPASGYYGTGQDLVFTVAFNEAVQLDTAGGTPRLLLDIGGTTRYADFVAFAPGGADALLFRYTVAFGDNDLDGITLFSPIGLNGATLRDVVGNDTVLDFAPPVTTGVRVSTQALLIFDVIAGDNRVNAAEQAAVAISGNSGGLFEGETVTVTVSDGVTEIVRLATVNPDGTWFVPGVDLTGLADGPLTVQASGFDLAGNSAVALTSITKDTRGPGVWSVGLSQGELTAADAGHVFSVSATYGEAMDQAVAPVVTFSVDLSTTLVPSLSYWSSDRTFVATYAVQNSGVNVPGRIWFTFSGGQDLAGNPGGSYTPGDALALGVNMETPSVVGLAATPAGIFEGDTVTLTGRIAGVSASSTYYAYVNWADGSGVQAFVLDSTNYDPATRTFTLRHVYANTSPALAAVSSHAISMYVLGGCAVASPTATTAPVYVSNAAPEVQGLTVTGLMREGYEATLAGTVSDRGLSDQLTVRIDWGDSSPETVLAHADLVPGPTPGTWLFSTSHPYADNPAGLPSGQYPINVQVTDEAGGTGGAAVLYAAVNVPPMLLEPLAVPAPVGGIYHFLAPTVEDVPADTLSYLWTVTKDGVHVMMPFPGQNLDYTPTANGEYLVTFYVGDDDGGMNTVSATLLVSDLEARTATITASGPVLEGTPVTLTASASGTAGAVSYEWLVTRGATTVVAGWGPTFAFTPEGQQPGVPYSVMLRVTDAAGQISSAQVQVANAAPTITDVDGPTSGFAGLPLSFIASAADPGGDPLAYAWRATRDGVPYGEPGSGATFSFVPDSSGEYRVLLVVSDDSGATAAPWERTLAVTAAPGATLGVGMAGPTTGTEGQALSFFAVAFDPSGAGALAYAWTATGPGGFSASGDRADFSFVPPDQGEYAVSVTVTAPGGSAVADRTVAVSNVAPAIASVALAVNPATGARTFTATVADVPADTLAYTWTVTCDGIAQAIPQPGGNVLAYVPPSNGNYAVTVVVDDGDGGTAQSSTSFAVTDRTTASLPFADGFDRAASPSLGSAWTDTFGDMQVSGQKAVNAAAGVSVSVLNGVSETDVAVEADIAVEAGSGRLAGLLTRYGAGGYYRVDVQATATGALATLYAYTSAIGQTPLASAPIAGGATGRLRLETVGSSQKVFLDGRLVVFANDARVAGPGTVGVKAAVAGTTLDNFAAAKVAPTAALAFSDEFSSSSAATLEQLDDAKWVETYGNFKVKDDAASNAIAGVSVALLRGVSATDMAVSADIAAGPGQLAGVLARYGPGGYYRAEVQATTAGYTVSLFRYSAAGGSVVLGSRSFAGDATGTLRLETVGASQKVFFAPEGGSSSLALSAHDGAVAAPGTAGMKASGLGAKLESFAADALPSSWVAAPYQDGFESSFAGQLDSSKWVETYGNFTVDGGLACNATAELSIALLRGASSSAAYAQGDITVAPGGTAGLFTQYSASGYYRVDVTATATSYTVSLVRWTPSGGPVVLDSATVAGTLATRQKLRLETRSGMQKVFLGDMANSLLDASDTVLTAAGTMGMKAGGPAGTTLDLFEAGVL